MTKELEIVDALPGCGKTTAIYHYMDRMNREGGINERWIYLSPMKDEINIRLQHDIERLGLSIEFFVPESTGSHIDRKTMTIQTLEALKEGKNIACTHSLMMRFTKEHLLYIKYYNYNIVCDEELNLITAYNELTKSDVQFLLENNHITIREEDGRIDLITDIPDDSRYQDVATYARLGCLYTARKRTNFLVIQMPPDLVEAANRFILLTYLYKGSIMDTFMCMHGFKSKELNLELMYSETERIAQLRDLIQFIEIPSVKKVQRMNLSATAWRTMKQDDLTQIQNTFDRVLQVSSCSAKDTMLTLPKMNITGKSEDGITNKIFKSKRGNASEMYVQSTARATNQYADRTLAVHMLDVYPNQPVVAYMQDMNYIADRDNHALSTLIQWLFRGCIRKNQPMKIALLSGRMSLLLKTWLSKADI